MKPVTHPKSFRQNYLETLYSAENVRFTLQDTLEGDKLWEGRLFALITAANPRSKPLSDEENNLRNAMLEGELLARGWKYGPSFGTDRAVSWKEDGFVVWDQTADDLLELGREFQQNAIVYGAAGWVALGWCDDWELERFTAQLEPEL
jgi:hypothetical protein